MYEQLAQCQCTASLASSTTSRRKQMWQALIPAAVSLFTGMMAKEGQEDTNYMNRTIAENNSAFNADQARILRDWQEGQNQKAMDFSSNMAGTAYQRAVKDMQTAGLNPMLAYSQGGAHAPGGVTSSGAHGTAVQPAEMRNPAGAGIAAAAQAASMQQTAAQTKNIEAQTDKTRVDTELQRSLLKDPDAERNAAGDLPTKSFPAASEEARSRQLHYAARHEIEKLHLTKEQWELVKQEIKNAVQSERNIRANTRNTQANAVLHELAEAEARNAAEHHKKYPGYRQDVGPFIGDIGKIFSSASQARRAFQIK